MLFLVAENAAKKILIPSGDIGTDWRGGAEPFDDSLWTAGAGGVGYCTDPQDAYYQWIGIDLISSMYNVNGSCYIRIPFTIASGVLAKITDLALKLRYDDGFVVYINGTEVKRVNSPTTLVWNSMASASSAEATSAWNTYDITAHINLLVEGDNVLCIHGLNANTLNSDFLISSQLITVTAHTLTYSAGANGSIVGATPQTVADGQYGSAVEVKPNLHYHFVNWSDNSTQNPRQDIATGDITVTANFAYGTPPPSTLQIVGQWPMDDNTSDNIILDTSGNGRNAVAVYGTTAQLHVAGNLNGALNFNYPYGALYAYAYCGSIPQVVNTFKIISSVYYPVTRPDDRLIFQRTQSGFQTPDIIAFSVTGITVKFITHSVTVANSQLASMSPNVWYKFEAVYDRYADDGIRLKLYMDDVLVGSSACYDEPLSPQDTQIIFAGRDAYKGMYLDEVEFWVDTPTHTLNISAGTGGSILIPNPIKASAVISEMIRDTGTVSAIVSSVEGFTIGDSVTVDFPASSSFDGTFTLTNIFTDGGQDFLQWSQAGDDADDSGSGTATAYIPQPYIYDEGAAPQIKAQANDGYHFVAWTGDLTYVGNSEYADTTIVMSADATIEATFEADSPPTQYTLTYSAGDHGHIEGDSPQLVNEGENGSPVTAVPDEHYQVANPLWTNDELG